MDMMIQSAAMPAGPLATPRTAAPHVLVITFSKVSNEPRATRQVRALLEAGCRVTLAGYAAETPPPDGCEFIALEPPINMVRLLNWAALAGLLGCWAWRRSADIHYWVREENRLAAQRLADCDADIVVCHDYNTVPLGRRIARKRRARLVVDLHEYALGEYPENETWKRLYVPYIDALQSTHLPHADAVMTVSGGIARQLKADYPRMPAPIVVRNTPSFEPSSFRPTGERIEVLYHGLLVSMRDIHVMIEAFTAVRAEFHLVLRGPGDANYVNHLRQLVQQYGLNDRVRIEPPVGLRNLVRAARSSDIGIFLHRSLSPQMQFVLPNKLFEYIMAGLAICVSDLDEMAPIVNQHQCGILVEEVSAVSVAKAINSLDRASIDRFKQNSIAAARKLCWENESRGFLRACGVGRT